MLSSLTPTVHEILTVQRWTSSRCQGFSADSQTLILEDSTMWTLRLWHTPTGQMFGPLDLHRYAVCGGLAGYRGIILLEHTDTSSQLHHWDSDGSLTPIMARLPAARLVIFLPGGQRAILADRSWHRSLITLPEGRILAPLPGFGLDYAATEQMLVYSQGMGETVPLLDTQTGTLIATLSVPDFTRGVNYYTQLEDNGASLFIKGIREPAIVIYRWDIGGIHNGSSLPLAQRLFLTDDSKNEQGKIINQGSAVLYPSRRTKPIRWECRSLVTGEALPAPQPPVTCWYDYIAPDRHTHFFHNGSGLLCWWSADDPVDAVTVPIQAHQDADQVRRGFEWEQWSPDSRWLVTSGTNRLDELAAAGRVPEDDESVDPAIKNNPDILPHRIERYAHTTKLWRVR